MLKQTRYLLLLIVLLSFVSPATGQKQLIVLKGQDVLLRLYPGDEIVFKLKGSKKILKSYVNNLYDTAVLAHNSVIPYHRIDRIYFRRSNLLNVVGGVLVIGGIAYFVIDQVNVVLVQGEDPHIDESVATASAIMVAAGLPMILLRKKYVRVRGRYRVMTVDKGSGFYVPDIRHDATELGN